VKNCVSFYNRAAGFYQNHHPVPNYYYNNTYFANNGGDFNLLGYDLTAGVDTNKGILRNNIAFGGMFLANATGASVDSSSNSWNLSGVTVSNADFLSMDTNGIYGTRKADGSLFDVGSMHLRNGPLKPGQRG
jgi:hypothetical protein